MMIDKLRRLWCRWLGHDWKWHGTEPWRSQYLGEGRWRTLMLACEFVSPTRYHCSRCEASAWDVDAKGQGLKAPHGLDAFIRGLASLAPVMSQAAEAFNSFANATADLEVASDEQD